MINIKILGFDIIDAAGIAVVSSYLTAVVCGTMSNGRGSAGILLSIVGNVVKSGLTKIDDSLYNYIEEKDEEMMEKVKAVKKARVHKDAKPIKSDSNKYKIFM